jgi:hypothetical protein
LTEANLSEEKVEQQLGDETVELKFVAEWKLSATRGSKDITGDQIYFPTDKYGKEKAVQQRRFHKKRQPLEQLDRVIEEIRRLMLRST